MLLNFHQHLAMQKSVDVSFLLYDNQSGQCSHAKPSPRFYLNINSSAPVTITIIQKNRVYKPSSIQTK